MRDKFQKSRTRRTMRPTSQQKPRKRGQPRADQKKLL